VQDRSEYPVSGATPPGLAPAESVSSSSSARPPEPARAAEVAAAEAVDASAAAGSRPRGVRRHNILVRLTHWLTFPLVFAMVASGLQIYRAYPRFGERGGPYLANPFQDAAFPEWSRLGGWLAGGLNWHFMLMWPLMGVGLIYFAYMVVSGEWRKLVFRPRDVRPALEMAKYYLRLRPEHPAQGKHNALQKQAYTLILLLGVLSVVSGLAMWKPVQLSWLVTLLGGFQRARYWHFWAVWLFVGFTVVHVLLVFIADPASLRGMITGRYRGRYTSDEA
jgi:thiosulfate reductase cytochrome b subunit